ncbi:MAG: FtsX-like permease family protein [Pirellulaceae bacterium]
MNRIRFAIASLVYYWRPNLALAFAVAAATAVLVGALVVGSSMRGSLRDLTLERLGRIDEIIVADHFFRQDLVAEIRKSITFENNYSIASGAILFPNGIVESQRDGDVRRANDINVLGVDDSFWDLQTDSSTAELSNAISENRVLINRALADDLGISGTDIQAGTARLTLRIPKPTLLPNDSALGKKKDLVESLVDLPVGGILGDRSLGRFALEPSQQLPRNIYLKLDDLQAALARGNASFRNSPQQCNAVLLAGISGNDPPTEQATRQLLDSITVEPEDLGIVIRKTQLKTGEGDGAQVVSEYWNLSTERLVFTDEQESKFTSALPSAETVQTYLVNSMSSPSGKRIPYSMVSAIAPSATFKPLSAIDGKAIAEIGDDEIVLNDWAAKDLEAKVGDRLTLTFFEPESSHGEQQELSVELTLRDVVKIASPETPFRMVRRELLPAVFTVPPTPANDPDMTPEVPGLTDSESIESWDLPFTMSEKIRPADDDYWNAFRTTPKGFVSLKKGRELWASRFGVVTGFRIPTSVSRSVLTEHLNELWHEQPSTFGLDLVPVKRSGLKAASGTTPFDALFLGLSMFIIVSALLLVSVLFRLGLQQRVEQLGLLSAVGFNRKQLTRIWSGELWGVCIAGAIAGVLLGIGYGWLMIRALTTWWVGAIATPFLKLHLSGLVLGIGFVTGLFVCWLTVRWTIRKVSRMPSRELLAGQTLEANAEPRSSRKGRWTSIFAVCLLTGAVLLSLFATRLGGESQAGAFMGGGFLVLSALLLWVYRRLQVQTGEAYSTLTLNQLAVGNARRNPLRSTMVIGLVGVATFLLVAISSFRLQPTSRSTGGAVWIAETSLPIVSDLGSEVGRKELGVTGISAGTRFYSLRYKPGQDASCNNLYQSTQPQVMGVPDTWIERFDTKADTGMLWAGSLADNAEDKSNPWRLLHTELKGSESVDHLIPVVIDKNTAMYRLKIYAVGTVLHVDYDSGESLDFKVVGFLENSIFQGSLLIGEREFKRAFPDLSGYQRFLIVPDEQQGDDLVARLEDALGDFGMDVQSTDSILRQYASVQNTYLSAFQSLGGLGLLLGTLGLAAVQMRSIVERRKELALMQAIGFRRGRLLTLLFREQIVLLLGGVGVGVIAALATTVPHWFSGSASMPWTMLLGMLGLVVAVGVLAALASARSVMRLPLASTLRG